MKNGLIISNIFCTFEGWIGRTCKPSDKGKLTAFPRFPICQQKFNNVSNMLRFEELPEVNSERWLSLEDLPGEEWRYREGTEKCYQVSNYGRIKSLSRVCKNNHSFWKKEDKIRRSAYNKKGYLINALTVNGKCVSHCIVHREVAKAFIPNPYNKKEVDHINTIRVDNRVSNLRWVTSEENAHNPISSERVKMHAKSRCGKHLSEETRNKIRETLKNGASSGFWQKGELSARSVPVVQLTLDGEFVKEWPCISEAYKEHKGHIGQCCRGEREMAGGFKWKYKKDYTNIKEIAEL